MMTDPVADMLTRIRNGMRARHTKVDIPASNLKCELARILQEEAMSRITSASTTTSRGSCASSCGG